MGGTEQGRGNERGLGGTRGSNGLQGESRHRETSALMTATGLLPIARQKGRASVPVYAVWAMASIVVHCTPLCSVVAAPDFFQK